MAEYISREGAIERIQPHVKPTSVYGEGYMQAIEHAVEILSLMPAADVQPVKRGKWFHSKKNYGFIICSQCKHEAYWDTDYGQQLFDYCPNCGADMTGGAENDT
jgi:hypothetical protein